MAFPEISRMFRRVISVRATRMAEQRTQIAAESRVKHVYKSAPVSPQQRSTKLFGNALESKDLGTAISLFRHVSHIVPFGDRMALFSLALQAPEMTTEIQVVLTSLLDGFLKTSDERQHIPTAYINGFTKSLAGKRNMTDTLAMVTKLLQHDCRVDIETLNSLLKLFAENGMHVQALQFIVSARANQMKVDIHSWCHLIAAFGNAGQPWDALHALKQAEESGIALNSQIMDSCLTAFAKSGQVKGIIHDKKITLTKGMYHSLMNGYKNASMPREVEKLFEGMQASSKHSKPDVVTLNILLDMYCKRGDHRTAEHLLNEMKESSIYPNTTSYNTLMNGYAVSHDLENCTRIFEGMKNDGSRPDAYTYTILISATGYAGKLTACDELYSEMAGLGVEPTLVTYSTLMDVNNAAANPTQVQKYFDIFTSKGYRPSSRIMWILMDSCRQSRKFDKLKELFEKARELDFVQAPFCHLMMCTFSNPVSDLAKLMHANHVAPTHRTLKLMLEGATAADKPVISLTYSKLASSAIPASLEMQYRDFCAKQ